MGNTTFDSRRYWKKKTTLFRHIADGLRRRVAEVEADYDQVETELKNMLATCTCTRKEN